MALHRSSVDLINVHHEPFTDLLNAAMGIYTWKGWELYTQWARSWAGREGPEHAHNTTSSRITNNANIIEQQPGQHQKAHMMTFHYTPTTITQPTSCVGGASPPPHNQQPWQPLLQPDCPRHSTWVFNWLNRNGGPPPGQWSGRGKRLMREGARTHSHSRNAQLQKARPNLSQHQLIN